MTTDIVPSYLDQIAIPDDLPGIQLETPRMYWYHGAKAGKVLTPGVFFAHDTAFTEPPPPPWDVDDRYAQTTGLGFSVPVLRLAFVGERSQWFIAGETDEDVTQWLPDNYEAPEGARIKKNIEYLVLVDGIADPMVLSVSGFYKSRPIENILRAYQRGAWSQEVRRRKRQLPRWTHFLPIGGRTDANGQPIIEPAKDATGKEYGSSVTPPALVGAPECVPEAVFQQAIDIWNLYNSIGWFKFKRLPQGVTEASYTIESRPALPAGKNIPQPIEDVDVL